MKRMMIIGAVCLVVGVGGGYMARKGEFLHQEARPGEVSQESRLTRRGEPSSPESGRAKKEREERLRKGEVTVEDCRYMTYAQVSDQFKKLREKHGDVDGLFFKDMDMAEALCKRWGQLAPKTALQDMRQMAFLNPHGIRYIFEGWAEKDPGGSFSYYKENYRDSSSPDERPSVLLSIVKGSVKNDLEGTWEFLSHLGDQERKTAYSGILETAMYDCPEKMGEILGKIDMNIFSNEFHYYYRSAIECWKTRGDQFYEETIALFPEHIREEFRKEELKLLVRSDLAKAGEILSGMSAEQQEAILRAIPAREMQSKLGLGGYFDWVTEHVPPHVAEKIVFRNIRETEQGDYAAIEQWFTKLSDSGMKDKLLEAFTIQEVAGGHDLTGMMDMVQKIQDDKARKKSMENVMKQWTNTHPDAALNWLEKFSGWQNDEKEIWRKQVEKAKQFMK